MKDKLYKIIYGSTNDTQLLAAENLCLSYVDWKATFSKDKDFKLKGYLYVYETLTNRQVELNRRS